MIRLIRASICSLLILSWGSQSLAATNLVNLQTITDGPVTFKMDASSKSVSLDQGYLLTLSYSAPEHIRITPPDLSTRFTGFNIDTMFEAAPTQPGTEITHQTKIRLLPGISREYRLAPFPIEYRDIRDPSAAPQWFATKPITLKVLSPLPAGQPADLGSVTSPVWIAPDTTTILIYLGYGLAVLAASAGLILLLTRLRKLFEKRQKRKRR